MSGLRDHIDDLCHQVEVSNPDYYRHWALYLQVLREVLPGRVRQACFHLATQFHPDRYAALPAERRCEFHARIDALVRRCGTLLTVEQLASLATSMARERDRLKRRDQEELLDQLVSARDGEDQETPPAVPDGSIRLGMAMPISTALMGWDASRSPFSLQGAPQQDGHDPLDEGSDDMEPEEDPEEEQEQVSEEAARAMAEAFSDALGASLDEALALHPIEPPGSLWQSGSLPTDPLALQEWIEGMEAALTRRLRNLSHALNVEALRLGVSRSLLPVNLLDAVAAGEIEPMAAPANLLRLRLPFGMKSHLSQVQVMAVLLRPADLELEEPRLRTCRRRLQQHRQELIRMGQQYRRLQRRLHVHEAEQLWLEDDSQNAPTKS